MCVVSPFCLTEASTVVAVGVCSGADHCAVGKQCSAVPVNRIRVDTAFIKKMNERSQTCFVRLPKLCEVPLYRGRSCPLAYNVFFL